MIRTPDGALPLMTLILFCSLFVTTWSMDQRPERVAGERPLPTGLVRHHDEPTVVEPRVIDVASVSSELSRGNLLPGEYIVTINGTPCGQLILTPEVSNLAEVKGRHVR